MPDSCITVRYVTNDGEGHSGEVSIAAGTTLGQFLQNMGAQIDKSSYVRVNSKFAAPDQVLHDGDKVTVAPKKLSAAGFPPLKRRKLDQYLRARGYTELPGTATSHKFWQHPETNKKLTVSLKNRQVSKASLDDLASMEGLSIFDLVQEINPSKSHRRKMRGKSKKGQPDSSPKTAPGTK